MKKRLFKKGILILGISILLGNCTKDSDIDFESPSPILQENTQIIDKIDYSTIINDSDFIKTIQKTSVLNRISEKNENQFYKKGINDYDIVKNYVYQLKSENYVSYTIPIKRNNTSSFENLVVEKTSLGTQIFLLSYKNNSLVANKSNNMGAKDESNIDDFNDVEVTLLESDSNDTPETISYSGLTYSICNVTTTVGNNNCSVHGAAGFTNPNCLNFQLDSRQVVTVNLTYCPSLGPSPYPGGGGGGDNNPSPTSPTSSGGGGGGGIGEPNGPIEPPLYLCTKTDPITGECIELERNISMVSVPMTDLDYFEEDQIVGIDGSSSEGSDQIFTMDDEAFWSNPNLVFLQQNKPSFADFFNAYPKSNNNGIMAPADVFSLIGGNVNAMAIENNWTNACAARVSRALNYSGVHIPNIPGFTFKGGDGKYYFLGANNLYEWMKKTFGEPDFSMNSKECGKNGDGFIQKVNGHSGIYIMLPVNRTSFGASGHADIYSGFGFNKQGYFNATGGLNSANLWSLN